MKLIGLVIIFLECPTWKWHYDLTLDSLLLMAKAALKVYFFFRHLFGLSIMSRRFSPQDSFSDINMYKALPIYLVYVVPTYFESDPSIETDPSEATLPHVIRLDSKASSTTRSKVKGRGGGGWGNSFVYS